VNIRAKAFFSLILVLIVGVVIGGAVNHLYVSKFSPGRTPDSSNRRSSNRHFPVKEMIERLQLDPDQEKQLHGVLERRREDLHKAEQAYGEARSVVKKRARAEILEILTEDQARRLDEFLKELRSRRRSRTEESNSSPSAREQSQ
jgi:hypothetical protein